MLNRTGKVLAAEWIKYTQELTVLENVYLAAYIGKGQNTKCPRKVAALQIAAMIVHRRIYGCQRGSLRDVGSCSVFMVASSTEPAGEVSPKASFSVRKSFQSKFCGLNRVMMTEYGKGENVDAKQPYIQGRSWPVDDMVTVP